MLKIMFMILFTFFILIILVVLNIIPLKEGFEQNLINIGKYPDEQTILDDYPIIGKNTLSNKSYNDIWKDKPEYKLGSYKQLTNNQKYYANPDNGTCIRADFCDALYNNKQVQSNIIEVLPPVPINQGTRVGYFITDIDNFI